VKALLVMHAGDRGLSEPDLEHALAGFDRLKAKTAKRVLDFYEKRRKATGKATKIAPVIVEAEAKVELAEAV
jgi:hypothetical protein